MTTYDASLSTFSELVSERMTETEQRLLRKVMVRSFGYGQDGTAPKVRKPTHPSIQRNPQPQLPAAQKQPVSGNGYPAVVSHRRG